MNARIYVLDVPENTPVVEVARADQSVSISKIGPYFRLTATGDLIIDRVQTGVRHAVWYSVIAGLEESRIIQQDKSALRVVGRAER